MTGLDGTMEQPIPVKGDWRFAPTPIGASAVGPDGRIVPPIAPRDSWFWAPAIFDPRSGEVNRIPLPFMADPPSPGWTDDGRIIATSYSLRSSLWRFRPATGATTP